MQRVRSLERKLEETQNKAHELELERARNESAGSADRASLDLFAHSARQSIDLAMEQAKAAINQAGGKSDGLNMVELLTALKTLMPQPDGKSDDRLLEIMRQGQEAERVAVRAHMETMARMMEGFAKQQEAAKEHTPAGSQLAQSMRDAMGLFEMMNELTGGGRSKGTDWSALAAQAMPVVAPLLGALTQFLTASAMRGAGGAPMAGYPGQMPPGQPQPGQIAPPAAQQPQPGQTAPAPSPYQATGAAQGPQPGQTPGYQAQGPGTPPGAPQAGQTGGSEAGQGAPAGMAGMPDPHAPMPGTEGLPDTFRTPANIQHFLDQLKSPLVRYINRTDTNGEDFAEWLMDFKDEDHYVALISLGVDGLVQILQMHQPTWAELSSREPKVREFLKEFVDYADQVLEDEEEDGRGDESQGDGQGDQDGGRDLGPEPEQAVPNREVEADGMETAYPDLSRAVEQGGVAVAEEVEPVPVPTPVPTPVISDRVAEAAASAGVSVGGGSGSGGSRSTAKPKAPARKKAAKRAARKKAPAKRT